LDDGVDQTGKAGPPRILYLTKNDC
jgi:hypothetical protein